MIETDNRKNISEIYNKMLSVRNIVLIAIAVSLITICTWITIPIGPVSFTLQIFAICVISGLLGFKRGFVALISYIILGIIGLPVFSGFSSGILKFIPYTETGMTGGFIIGFSFVITLVGIFRHLSKGKENKKRFIYLSVGMVLGYIICIVFGTFWFWLFNPMHLGIKESICVCIIPFIIPDIIKIVIALVVVDRVGEHLKKWTVL